MTCYHMLDKKRCQFFFSGQMDRMKHILQSDWFLEAEFSHPAIRYFFAPRAIFRRRPIHLQFFFSVMMKLANEKTHKLGYYQVENKTNDELLLRKLLKQFNITWIKGTRVSTQTLWHFYWQLQVSCMICHTTHLFELIMSIVVSSKTHTSNVCNSFDTYM